MSNPNARCAGCMELIEIPPVPHEQVKTSCCGATATYMHKEALCLMWYQCQQCGARIRVWNSRDGVTPFMMRCRGGGGCEGSMGHVNFALDLCVPDHHPEKGDVIFVDLTVEALQEAIQQQIEEYWDGNDMGVPAMSSMFDTKEEALASLTESRMQEGAPMVAHYGYEAGGKLSLSARIRSIAKDLPEPWWTLGRPNHPDGGTVQVFTHEILEALAQQVEIELEAPDVEPRDR